MIMKANVIIFASFKIRWKNDRHKALISSVNSYDGNNL